MYIKLLHNQRLLTMFSKMNLFFLLIIFLSFLLFWGLWLSLLLSGSLSKPLGEFSGWSLAPFIIFLFPDTFKVFCSNNFPSSLIHFLSVIIRSGVCSTLILGVHADLWWVLSSEGLWVKTLLKGLSSELSLLSLLQLLKVKLLGEFSLFIVIFISLKLDDVLEELLSLGLDFIRVHSLKLKWLDSDGEGNLLLFLKLLLGLGELLAGITDLSSSSGFLLVSHFSLLGLLGLKHLLTLSLSLLKALLLLLSLLGLSLSLFLLHLFLFLSLGLIELLLLLKSDLLPLGLLLLEFGELILLLLPGLSPFRDVLLELVVQLLFPLCLIICHSDCCMDPTELKLRPESPCTLR